MKHPLPLLLLLAFLLLPLSATADGATYVCDGWRYELEDGGAVLVRCLGEAPEAVIPLTLDGHPVTGTRGNPFCAMYNFSYHTMDCTVAVAEGHGALAVADGVLYSLADSRLVWHPKALGREKCAVPAGTVLIGSHAFRACRELTAVTLPEGITAIGNYAFSACPALTDLNLPEGLTAIGDCAFAGCRSLARLRLPESLTAIGFKAFDGCPALVLEVTPGSWAEAWCRESGMPYETAAREIPDV